MMSSSYDGTYKHLTKDCADCPYYDSSEFIKKAGRGAVTVFGERCFWGVAWKILVKVDNPKTCTQRKRTPPGNSSEWMLDQEKRRRIVERQLPMEKQ